jgi:HKD family nuclease
LEKRRLVLYQMFLSQPAEGVNYLNLFREVLRRATINRFDAAVAYATSGGVSELDAALREVDARAWENVAKRWLVGIDYCRTEPLALRRLQQLPHSSVRIHAGEEVVARRQCTPILPFHPKVFLVRGPNTIGAICGSGNLSRNGLTKGHEVGNLILTSNPSTSSERGTKRICDELVAWYRAIWSPASAVDAIFEQYQNTYELAENLRVPTPTDDDTGETEILRNRERSHRVLDPEDLRRLRACRHLWIEAGNLTRNRGPLRPGNQLMLTPMTRVFFGFPARDLLRDTLIGRVAITYGAQTRDDCSLVFSNNSMDKLTLPVPGSGGPPNYDGANLLFTKQIDGSFLLALGSSAQKDAWVRASRAIEGHRSMTSGRQWGVF